MTAKSFVDAWNDGASLKNNQKNAYFFGYIEGGPDAIIAALEKLRKS